MPAGAARGFRPLLGLVVSAGALWFALRGVDLREVARALGAARPAPVVAAVILTAAIQVVRAERWRGLFGDGPRPGRRDAFWIVSFAYLVSTLLPLRAGDPARAWLAWRRAGAGMAEALATVVAERILDLGAILALMAFATPGPLAALLGDRLGPGPWASAAVLRAGIAGALALGYGAAVAVAAHADATRRALGPSLAGRVAARFVNGFAPLARPRVAAAAALWSLTLWLLGAASYWLVMRALGIEVPVTVAVVTLGVTAVFAVVPSSPGYVGVFEAAVRVALEGMTDLGPATIASYAVLLHGMTLATLLALGLAGAWSLGIGIGAGAAAARAATAPPDGAAPGA